MAIYKRGAVYWYEFLFKGERVRESTRQGNQNTARTMESAHRTRLAKGEVGIVEKKAVPTLAEFGPKFTAAIETLCAEKPSTITFYKSKLSHLLKCEDLAKCPLDAIDEALVDAFKQKRAREISNRGTIMAVASVNRELATLRRMIRLAHEWKLISRIPRIRLLRGERGREFVLSFEQEKLYLATAGDDLRDISMLLVDTGLRTGEALSLEWPDVHMSAVAGATYGYVKVRAGKAKNSKSRNVPIAGRVVEMLQRRKPSKAGYVFHRLDGQPHYQVWLNREHSELRTLLKMPADFVPHSLRHTFGTRLGESGADVFTIMKLMGHSSVIVSQKYVHPSPEATERAMERLEALNKTGRQAVEIPTISTTVGKLEAKEKRQ